MSEEVTIVMPVYNDPMCDRAVQSVVNQRYDRWRLEILDNGCTDDKTLAVFRKYEGHKGITVTHFPFNRQSECGALFAMRVKTPLTAFLFSDDQWHPEFLNRMVGKLGDHDAVFCNTSIVDEDGVPWKRPSATQFNGDITDFTPAQLLRCVFYERNPLHPCAMVVRTGCFQSLGGLKPYLHKVGDMRFFMRLMAEAGVVFLKEKLAFVTEHSLCSYRKNLSAGFDKVSLGMMAERQRSLQLFVTPPFLKLANEVFGLKDAPRGKAGLLFSVGLEALKNPSPDYFFFGFSCVYNALDLDYEAVNAWCMANHHTSAGEFIKTLQGRAA